ncbi:hypothetical protein Lal_00001186 [Lupinus albus]|uniref:Putative transcription factor MYB-HB-like family n=1 Tax=Lupinus albus TaxID=3870 RepID=A0A6A5P1K7_LUPAL|nr:putative transcription factor MYB-HB-like family [Lupinus albus]KAF1891050.1 hypothetical protein Lal_00001186 [Lupinus albus]
MASNTNSLNNYNQENCSSWTVLQNKRFEKALVFYNKDTKDRWQNIANVVGDKSAEEIERHYQILVEDIEKIESGLIPIPEYNSTTISTHVDEEQRILKYLTLN